MSLAPRAVLFVCGGVALLAHAQTAPPASAPAPRTAPIRFTDACAAGEIATVGVLGDVLFHASIQRELYAIPEGAQAMLADIAPVIEGVDFAIANQESPLSCCVNHAQKALPDPGRAFDGAIYTSENTRGINASPTLARELRAAGIDALTTANNHAFDRLWHGVYGTLDALDDAGLHAIGTRRSPADPWATFIELRGLRLALLACTQWTNGPVDDPERVRFCFEDLTILDDIAELSLRRDVDGVIVLPHAGDNRDAGPEPELVSFAQAAVDAGAVAVIIGGRHGVQGWEKRVAKDGREAFVSYATGDLISDALMIDPITSVMIVLGLARGADGKAVVRGAQAVPLFYPPRGSRAPRRVQLLAPDTKLVEERALVLSRIGPANTSDGALPLDVVPHCKSDFVEPEPWQGSVGDGCHADVDCATGLRCLGPYFDRMCTRACTNDRDCVAQKGRAAGACVPYPTSGNVCVASCDRAGRCREGFECTSIINRRGAFCTSTDWPALAAKKKEADARAKAGAVAKAKGALKVPTRLPNRLSNQPGRAPALRKPPTSTAPDAEERR